MAKNLIVWGGDPTGTGSGGQSAWGTPFKDECHSDLKHAGRAALAKANSGPGTNKSQFYILLRGSWDHLDGKHTVFGQVVGGEETLGRVESVEVDKKNRPRREIQIINAVKYVDPFEDVKKALEEEKTRELSNSSTKRLDSKEKRPMKKLRSVIGA